MFGVGNVLVTSLVTVRADPLVFGRFNFQKHIHTVSYYEKGKRMIASWQQMRFVLESSVMVVLMESEFTLFFFNPWEHVFLLLTQSTLNSVSS